MKSHELRNVLTGAAVLALVFYFAFSGRGSLGAIRTLHPHVSADGRTLYT